MMMMREFNQRLPYVAKSYRSSEAGHQTFWYDIDCNVTAILFKTTNVTSTMQSSMFLYRLKPLIVFIDNLWPIGGN